MQAHTNASVSICNSHEEAETAIQTLKKFGFDVRKLSLIGKARLCQSSLARSKARCWWAACRP
jgi:hypothetical protein